ncbi:MAG: 50S ribosomal protein L25/general stress protein Ctc [Bacteroidetes bacterium]|nr:50S ribosomal protein L25/general stress protein Ctc [Bacteroidota bacterium]
MKTLTITGSKRTQVGKKDAADLRRSEMVPCVLYGGKEPLHFAAPEKEFKPLVYTPDIHAVKIDVGGTQFSAVMKDIQFHKVTDKIIHVDFLEITPGKAITMEIPVKTEGAAPGVRAGGKLLKKLRSLTAKGVLDKFPDAITVNVEKMEIGDSVRVKDIKLDGIEFLNTPNATVIAVRVTRNVEEEAPAAAATTAAAAPAAGTPAPAAGAPGAAAPAAGAKDAPKKDAPKK